MFELIGLGSMTGGEFWGAVTLVALVSLVLGSMTDALMKDAGFGVVGNAILCAMGAFMGAFSYHTYARDVAMQLVQRTEMAVMVGISMLMATVVLMVLALVKRIAMR